MSVSVIFIEKVLFALIIGAILGLEREFTKKQAIAGIRTFALVSIFGCVLTYLSQKFFGHYLLSALGFVFICFFAIAWFVAWARRGKKVGFTTNFALIITYLLGAMIAFDLFVEAAFLGVLIAAILFSRERLHTLVRHLSRTEVEDFLCFIILLGIIYPLIPQEPVVAYGVSLPLFLIWLFIIAISLINFAAFIAARHFTAMQEISLLSFFSGFVSSTVGTATLINLFKQNKKLAGAVASGFLLLTASMLIRNFALVMGPAPAAAKYLIVPLAIGVLVLARFAYLGMEKVKKTKKLVVQMPFNTLRAIKLGVFIMLIFVALNAVVQNFGSGLFLLVCFLGGFVSSEGVSVTIAGLLLQNQITIVPATIGLVFASTSSILSNYLLCLMNKTKPIIQTAKIVLLSLVLLIGSLVIIDWFLAH